MKPALLNRHLPSLLAVLGAIALTGCVSPASFTEPIVNFQKASTVVIATTRLEYLGANTQERNAVVDRFASERKQILLKEDLGPSTDVAESDDLHARLSALDALAKHGESLLALASSDAPEKAKNYTTQLGASLDRLNTTLNKAPDSAFKARAAAYSGAAAEIVDAVLQQKITRALEKAIISSESAVTTLIAQLRTDMFLLYERRRVSLSAKRVQDVRRFNAEVSGAAASSDRIEKAAASLKGSLAAYADLPLQAGAGEGLDQMADAHQHLVAYARSAKTPQDFSAMVDAVDAFTARATAIADAVKSAKTLPME